MSSPTLETEVVPVLSVLLFCRMRFWKKVLHVSLIIAVPAAEESVIKSRAPFGKSNILGIYLVNLS